MLRYTLLLLGPKSLVDENLENIKDYLPYSLKAAEELLGMPAYFNQLPPSDIDNVRSLSFAKT